MPTKAPSKISSQAERQDLRNPDWTREETLLALDVYLRLKGEADLLAPSTDVLGFIDPREGAIIELSNLLLLYAEQRGVVGAGSLRNAYGVGRKVNKFRAAALGNGPETVRGAKLEHEVWHEFLGRWDVLRTTASALRAGIRLTADEHRHALLAPSRGPVPSLGTFTINRGDRSCVVYLLTLQGAATSLFLPPDRPDCAMVKIGRSNDIARRLAELHAGFPPTLNLRWQLTRAWKFPGAEAAHVAEQALLADIARRRWALGGEFAAVPRTALNELCPPLPVEAVPSQDASECPAAIELHPTSRRRSR